MFTYLNLEGNLQNEKMCKLTVNREIIRNVKGRERILNMREMFNLNLNNDLNIDSYKRAFRLPAECPPISIGLMNKICVICTVRHFSSEATANNDFTYKLCCHKGKVVFLNYIP